MKTESTQWKLPPSNAGSPLAQKQILDVFGPNGWDSPVAMAGLLTALIDLNNQLRVAHRLNRPTMAWLTDPGDDWGRYMKQLDRANTIFVGMRKTVGKMTDPFDSSASDGPIMRPLLYGDFSWYDETKQPRPNGVRPNEKFPLMLLPYNVGVAINALAVAKAQVLTNFIEDDLGDAVTEGITNVGEAVGFVGATVAQGAGEATAGLGAGVFKGVWNGLGTSGKIAAFGIAAYFIRDFLKGRKDK